MKLFVGLGNPGTDLALTRHNAGFLFLDYLSKLLTGTQPEFLPEKKFHSAVLRVKCQQKDLVLAKPQTYMNDSGRAVSSLISFYRLKPSQSLWVFHDDLDLPFGDFKLSFGKGPHVHNGLNSITNSLKTPEFWRVRLGIAGITYQNIRESGQGMAENYILKPFTQEEQQQLPGIFEQVGPKLLDMVK